MPFWLHNIAKWMNCNVDLTLTHQGMVEVKRMHLHSMQKYTMHIAERLVHFFAVSRKMKIIKAT